MIHFNPKVTRQIAGSVAITAVLGLITLILLYSGLPFFGPVNDLLTAFGGFLILLLAWQFHPLIQTKAPVASFLLLLAAFAGSATIAANAVLVAFGRMAWQVGGMYTALGYVLIGIWLLGMLYVLKTQPFLTPTLLRLGTAAGTAMLFGVLAGPLLAGSLELSFQPLAWLSYALAALGWILFPVWCWLLRNALAKQ